MQLQIRFRGLSDTIRLLGCFSLEAEDIPACTMGEEKKKFLQCERKIPPSVQRMTLSTQASIDSARSSVSFEGSLDIDPSSVLYAASEMLKNLFDMATDSFGLKSGSNLAPALEVEGRNGVLIPYIYHPGAVTAAVDLLPAISEMNGTVLSEVDSFS